MNTKDSVIVVILSLVACQLGSGTGGGPGAPAPVASTPTQPKVDAGVSALEPPVGPLPTPVAAECGKHGEEDLQRNPTPEKKNEPTCIATKGCDGPTIGFPPCPSDIPAIAANNFDGRHLKDGTFIAVYGKLQKTLYLARGGQMMACRGCCDNVRLYLGVADVRSDDWPWFVLRDERFLCVGDESMTCCRTDAVCKTVIVQGRVRKLYDRRQRRDGVSLPSRPVYEVLDPQLCVVKPGTPASGGDGQRHRQ